MKINDPFLCPDAFGLLRLRRLSHDTRCGDTFALIAGGLEVAELGVLYDDDGSIVLDQHQDYVMSRGGCWSLDLIWSEGQVAETHILCLSRPSKPGFHRLTHEVAAWAMLTVLWATTPRTPQQG